MYYEARQHASQPVANAEEAATRIHNGQVNDYDALTWAATNGRRLAVVADHHIDNMWKEVAVIDLDRQVQIESITFGWIEDLAEKIQYLKNCETTDYVFRNSISLPLDGNGETQPAEFECGCCGEGFMSTIAEQQRFDQDAGYGICLSCNDRYWKK